MAYDSAARLVVAYGGGEGGRSGQIWVWNGESWARRHGADPEGDGDPALQRTQSMSYDPRRGKAVLIGQGTWELSGASFLHASPAQALSLHLRSAVLPGREIGVRSLQARWRAGAVGYPDGVETPGVRLHAWDPGYNTWRQVASVPAPPGDPEWSEWSTNDARLLEELPVGDQLEIGLAVAAPANGARGARVETEYLEVTVGFRRLDD